MRRTMVAVVAVLALAASARAARPRAAFALIIGADQSVDRELPTLRYADDDAARYFELFRALRARTQVLTRPDENTARLHPQVVAVARPPRHQELERAITALAAELAQARARGVATVFYFVYAGHGNVRDGRGYITLEDARLDGPQLGLLADRVGADESHIIVDACFSYYLAFDRGPGGRRRDLHGFTQLDWLTSRPSVGLLLSTSSEKESHEWERFQSGVFSYEVRAGLYGAADVDGDGEITYREIAAFVASANQAIANERFRPDVYARPPRGSPRLVDLRAVLDRRLDIEGRESGHYLLEDSRGVRVAEFHSGRAQAVHLLRPSTDAAVYLRRLDGEPREWTLPELPEALRLSSLYAAAPNIAARGAAQEAFSAIFSRPFMLSSLDDVLLEPASAAGARAARAAGPRLRPLGIGLIAGGLGFAVAGLACGVAAKQASDQVSEIDRAHREFAPGLQATGRATQIAEGVLLGAGAAAVVTGIVLYARGRLAERPGRALLSISSAPAPRAGLELTF